jgi:hypothetical protein
MVGNPGKIVKQVSDEMLEWKREGTRLYQQLPDDCRESLRPCEPLREIPAERIQDVPAYRTWNETKAN